MISANFFDIQVLGELDTEDTRPDNKYFIRLKVDEDKGIVSKKTRRGPALGWKEKQSFQFDVSSAITIEIFRKSRAGQYFAHSVAKYAGQGIDLLANDHALLIESEDKKGPRISIKLDVVVEDHAQFMKAVDEDMMRMPNIKGADGTQIATTIGGQLGAILKNIVPIIDQFAGSHPVLNTAWIVLSSVYKILQKQLKLDGTVQELVEILREMAGEAAICHHLGKIEGAVDIIEEIGRASLHVACLIHRYADPSIRGKPSMLARIAKHSLSDISSEVGEMKTRCAALSVTLQSRVGLDTNARARVIQDTVKDTSVRVRGIQDAQKKNDIHKWMCAPDSSPNYNAARKKRQAKTGAWFIEGSEFKEWKEKPGSVLWLDGGPGCGKTVTCATSIENVIDSCASRPSVGYAYFFFDGTSARSELRSHENLIKSIIVQLADRCDGIPTALDTFYSECDGGHRQPDLPSLEKALLGIVDGFDVAYIVIDSLDECAERIEVLKWIHSITSKTAGKLHMMVTSRPEQETMPALLSLSRMRRVSITGNRAVQRDIRRFIDGRLSELPKWSEERKKKVGDVLMRDADGMFRWVALQCDELMRCRNEEQLDEQLKSLPRGLNETYARILERSAEPDDLIRFLQWLAHSQRLMTLQELAEVALIDFGKDDSAVPVYKGARRYDDPNDILSICSGLVSAFEWTGIYYSDSEIGSISGSDSEIGSISAGFDGKVEVYVKLAHFSVNEYLVSLDIADTAPGVTLHYRTSECASHSMIAQTCIAYLQQFDKPGSITAANIESFPLAKYAANHWDIHLYFARTDINIFPALQNSVQDFFRPTTYCAFINWIRIRDSYRGGFDRETDAFGAPLWYACCYGVTEVVQFLIDHGADRKAEEGSSSELVMASGNGHLEIVKILVKNGVHLDAEGGGQYGEALEWASKFGYIEIIKVLLGTGVHLDTEREKGYYGEALQLASGGGQLEAVKLLVENGAYLGTGRGEIYGVALVTASSYGHSKIVELLVENGAHVETEGRRTCYSRISSALDRLMDRQGTSLVLASLRGDLESVKVLVEHGAFLDTEGGETKHSFNMDAVDEDVDDEDLDDEDGHNEDADDDDPPIKEERHGTALFLASVYGHLDIVKILVEKGALLDTEGEERDEEGNLWRGTALEAASAKGHLQIAELLAKAASDRMALQAAEAGEPLAKISAEHGDVYNGHEETDEVGRDDDGSSTGGESEELEFVLANDELEYV